MTTIRQLFQTSPVRANEFFAKLVDTSEDAVEARDRLFSELKFELELRAELQEQHLFPVLKKRKGTKGLVADALKENRHTRKLLAQLERTPRDSEAFGAKVTELQQSFQQHVPDEKKEFLPTIVNSLSDEEASTVVEKSEDEKLQVRAAQRVETDGRRAKGKREQQQPEAARERERAEANATDAQVKAAARRVQKDPAAAQARASIAAQKSDGENEQSEAARRAAADARPQAKRGMAEGPGAAAEIVEAGAKVAQQGEKTTPIVTKMSKAVQAGTVSQTTQEDTTSASRSMVALINEQARHAMETTVAVGSARTLAEAVRAQSDFIGGSFQRMGQFNERYLALLRGGQVRGGSGRQALESA